MTEITRYNDSLKETWDQIVSSAKNATFLLCRDFMDYHSERFEDHSLMVYYKGKPSAAIPICVKDNVAYSHLGLTYGGLILEKEEKLERVLHYFKAMLQYLHKNKVKNLIYKRVPSFYHSIPSGEDEYILFKLNSELIRRDTALVINQSCPPKIQERRKRSVKKGRKSKLNIVENGTLEDFWKEVLTPNLLERFGVEPVHSLKEITILKSRFPDSIFQANIYDEEDNILAGTTIFLTPKVAHAQYISGTDEGRRSGALDYLFHHLISETYAHVPYFDFGITNEEDGQKINKGLLSWKEGFGGRAYSHDFYSIDTSSYTLLKDIFTFQR